MPGTPDVAGPRWHPRHTSRRWKPFPFQLLYVRRVEHRSQFPVEGRDFDRITAAYECDCHVVAEVDGARVVRSDLRRLETCLREYQCLRIGVHSELFQEGRQVPQPVVPEFENGFPSLHFFHEASDSVVGRPVEILDRRVVHGQIRQVLLSGNHSSQHRANDEHGTDCKERPRGHEHYFSTAGVVVRPPPSENGGRGATERMNQGNAEHWIHRG